jgi:hypothetical protein
VKVVRDRPDARWLPSRFHFAIFKLFAFLRMTSGKAEERPGLVMAVDRDQSAMEHYIVATCVVLVATSFLASVLASWLPLAAACILAVPAAAVLLQVPVVMTPLLIVAPLRKAGMPDRYRTAVNSTVLMSLVIAAAVLLALGRSPLRPAGIGFLLLAIANAAASIVVFFLRKPIAEAERRRFALEP